MDYYYHELSDLQKEFQEVMHDYPLFLEMIQKIEDDDIKEINELLEKNDEFYLKKAISKLKDLIIFVKETSQRIEKEYQIFDKLATKWEKEEINNLSKEDIEKLNIQIQKANDLIKSHDLKEICEANKIMENVLKDIK